MLDREQADKIRRFLWNWGNTLFDVNRKEREIRVLQSAIDEAYETLKASSPDGMPRGTTMRSSVEHAVELAHFRIKQYRSEMDMIQTGIVDALSMKREVDALVDELDLTQRKIIQLRYIDKHRWQHIALVVHYDIGWVKVLERRAIDVLSHHIKFD